KRNILYTIIEFRNLKGRPEGANRAYLAATSPKSRSPRFLIYLSFDVLNALKELGRDTRFEDDIKSDKGYSGSLVTRYLKSITNYNLLRATFSISFFFGPPKKV
ncbi:hypothetical protein N7537_007511, partial [Penicillium hordei]